MPQHAHSRGEIFVVDDDAEMRDDDGASSKRVFHLTAASHDDDEQPSLQLDDLFHKTSFKPSLYWIECDEVAEKNRRAAAKAR